MQFTAPPSIYDPPPPTVMSHLKGLNDYNYMAVLGRGHFGKVSWGWWVGVLGVGVCRWVYWGGVGVGVLGVGCADGCTGVGGGGT